LIYLKTPIQKNNKVYIKSVFFYIKLYLILLLLVPFNSSYNTISTSSKSSTHKVTIQSSSYGVLDNYIVRSLSHRDKEKFKVLLLRLTVSCGWALHWVNTPEAKELFEFLNPYLKLPDRQTLGGQILKAAVSEEDKIMWEALREDPIGVTLTFDRWTNVKNEQLLGVMIITSEGKPYVWKATDISIERESHIKIMKKTKAMIDELKNMDVQVSAIVTDSAGPYAASRYFYLIFYLIKFIFY